MLALNATKSEFIFNVNAPRCKEEKLGTCQSQHLSFTQRIFFNGLQLPEFAACYDQDVIHNIISRWQTKH